MTSQEERDAVLARIARDIDLSIELDIDYDLAVAISHHRRRQGPRLVWSDGRFVDKSSKQPFAPETFR